MSDSCRPLFLSSHLHLFFKKNHPLLIDSKYFINFAGDKQTTLHMRKAIITLLLLLTLAANAQNSFRPRMSIDGQWEFVLDSQGDITAASPMTETVMLPGTTDTNQKGNAPQTTTETTRLTRLHSYVGRAWYRREVTIPREWKRHQVVLCLERTKPTVVYVDGQRAGESDDICTAQTYDLTGLLTPGRHTIALMVDNGETVPPQLLSNSHAYTEDTQTNWNGVIGEMYLEARPQTRIETLEVRPDAGTRKVDVVMTTAGKMKKGTHITVTATPQNFHGKVLTADYWVGRNLW